MCNATFVPRLSPMTATHAHELAEFFPEERDFIKDMFNVMTDHFRPQVNLLVMFASLKHLLRKNVQGVLESKDLLYVPLSVVAKTGEQEFSRFRPKAVRELHTSFLSFMMAKRNVAKVEEVCEKHGVKLSRNHCCGVIFGAPETVRSYEASENYKARCVLRSYAESMAMPVVEVEEIDEVPVKNIDLGAAEREFFALYETCMDAISLPESRSDVNLDQTPIFEAWANIVASEELPTDTDKTLDARIGLVM